MRGFAPPDNIAMKQQDLGLNLNTRRTGKAVFLDEMNLVVPWVMRSESGSSTSVTVAMWSATALSRSLSPFWPCAIKKRSGSERPNT